MDKIDLVIVNTLQHDARTPFTQIAKTVGVAEVHHPQSLCQSGRKWHPENHCGD